MNRTLHVVADNDNEDAAWSPDGVEPWFSPDFQDRFDFSREPPAVAGPNGGPA